MNAAYVAFCPRQSTLPAPPALPTPAAHLPSTESEYFSSPDKKQKQFPDPLELPRPNKRR